MHDIDSKHIFNHWINEGFLNFYKIFVKDAIEHDYGSAVIILTGVKKM